MARNPANAKIYRAQLLARILALVDICGERGCWLFIGTKWRGYGKISVRGRMVRTHHAAHYAVTGRWPAKSGRVWLHECDTPACCNPHHGRWGTVAQNNADRHRKGRTVLPDPEAAARGRQAARLVRLARLAAAAGHPPPAGQGEALAGATGRGAPNPPPAGAGAQAGSQGAD